jgi:hypothetical protein
MGSGYLNMGGKGFDGPVTCTAQHRPKDNSVGWGGGAGRGMGTRCKRKAH